MAKLTLTRFPDPRPEYDQQQSAELIRLLEELILQLNTQYTQDYEKDMVFKWLMYLKDL